MAWYTILVEGFAYIAFLGLVIRFVIILVRSRAFGLLLLRRSARSLARLLLLRWRHGHEARRYVCKGPNRKVEMIRLGDLNEILRTLVKRTRRVAGS
jgi:hypothetical protein